MKIGQMLAPALIIGMLVGGCGGSGTTDQTNTPPAPVAITAATAVPSSTAALDQAIVTDPNRATQLAESSHLNPLTKVADAATPSPYPSPSPTVVPVATLEANYETQFCQLSSEFNVTLQTPQSVAKINFIKSQPMTGYFDLLKKPIQNNPLGVTAVAFQPVTYTTSASLPGLTPPITVSGGLMMPLGIDKSKIRGVVTYFHGTTFNKTMVGSNYATNPETQLLAEVFASQGYIVVAPDYVGQGIDYGHVHPYVLYPTVSAQTAVDMLAYVKSNYIIPQYGYQASDPPLKLFTAGYSEGGSYSLWFNTYVSSGAGKLDPFYSLTHSVGMEGAYSTSSVTYNYLFGDVSTGNGNPFHIQSQALTNVVKPILSADAFLSYATYSAGSNYTAVISQPFFNLDCLLQSECDVNGEHLNIYQAFTLPDTTIALQLLYGALGKSANGASYPGALSISSSTTNDVRALVSSTLLTPAPQKQLMQVLQAADANLGPVADGSCSAITLAQDSVVVSNNFDWLASTYPTKLANTIKIDQNQLVILSSFSKKLHYPVWVPTDHLHGLIYEYLYALQIFNTH